MHGGAGKQLTLPSPCCSFSTVMVKMEWERLESWFISVAPTLLFFFPTYTTAGTCLEVQHALFELLAMLSAHAFEPSFGVHLCH